jgi:hypothetical protein
LELCYLHLQSLNNINSLSQRGEGAATNFDA